jgi:ketosteroid isomerase-like protein
LATVTVTGPFSAGAAPWPVDAAALRLREQDASSRAAVKMKTAPGFPANWRRAAIDKWSFCPDGWVGSLAQIIAETVCLALTAFGRRVIEFLPMATQSPTLDQIKLAMQKTNALFNTEVFGKRNLAALDDIYTSDARVLPPGAPMVSGREAIRQFWKGVVESLNGKSAVLSTVDLMPAGDGVVEIGAATLSAEPPGQAAVTMEVKYVVYWRQEAGRWKWHVDIWNTNA